MWIAPWLSAAGRVKKTWDESSSDDQEKMTAWKRNVSQAVIATEYDFF